MSSSTSSLESSERWASGVSIALIVAAPLLWLALLQTNYTLVYAACNDRSDLWLFVPSAAGLIVLTALFVLGVVARRRTQAGLPPRPFLGLIAVLFTGLCLLVLIATTLPPFILSPCD